MNRFITVGVFVIAGLALFTTGLFMIGTGTRLSPGAWSFIPSLRMFPASSQVPAFRWPE